MQISECVNKYLAQVGDCEYVQRGGAARVETLGRADVAQEIELTRHVRRRSSLRSDSWNLHWQGHVAYNFSKLSRALPFSFSPALIRLSTQALGEVVGFFADRIAGEIQRKVFDC